MALRSVLGSYFKGSTYKTFDKGQERQAKANLLFGQPTFTSAQQIEENLRYELEFTLNEDPNTAKTILQNALEKGQAEPQHTQALQRAGLNAQAVAAFEQERQLQAQTATQNAAILSTAASFAFASGLRLLGNAAANQAVTSGKVVQFEAQQQNFNNLKRASGLLGSLAGLGYASVALGPVGVATAAVAVTSQLISLGVENSRISAKQERQDSNAEYYQQAFGNIVRRGNR